MYSCPKAVGFAFVRREDAVSWQLRHGSLASLCVLSFLAVVTPAAGALLQRLLCCPFASWTLR